MINAIMGAVKYTGLVLLILVLSHIIQIKGTTISQHVENGMNWVSGGHSRAGITTRVSQTFSSAIQNRKTTVEPEDADGISKSDRNELDNVIKRSSGHRR